MRISRSWGSFDVYLPRHGVNRCRLVVFPPGVSAPELRVLRLWRGWPLWGAGLWVAAQIAGALTNTGITAFFAGTMLYIALGAVAFALTGNIRWRVRTTWAIKAPAPLAGDMIERYDRLHALARSMDRADRDLLEGRISAAEHEAAWWQAYDANRAVPAPQSAPPRRRVLH